MPTIHSIHGMWYSGAIYSFTEIIGGTEKIWAIPGYAHAPFSPKFLTGFCSHDTFWIYLPNVKFVALPVPEIIGGTQKIWAISGYAHAPFSPKFFTGLCSDGPLNISAKFEVPSFSHSWNNSDCSFGVGLGTPNLGEGEAIGCRGWYRSKELCDFL